MHERIFAEIFVTGIMTYDIVEDSRNQHKPTLPCLLQMYRSLLAQGAATV